MPEGLPATLTPDTRVGEMLERWPALEEALVEISPHFQALRNPVLRRTVARLATLRQVATVSGVPLGVLVERLRAAAGLAPAPVSGEDAAPAAPRPAWADPARAVMTLDARAGLEAGEHPAGEVMARLAHLGEGQVLALVTPFVPAPLLDLARAKGFASHSDTEAPGQVRTYFHREG
jgi:hypothetical protein